MWLVWRESPGGILLPRERILSILHGQANVLDGGESHRARAAACGGAQAMGSDVPFFVGGDGWRKTERSSARSDASLSIRCSRSTRSERGCRGQNRSDDGGSAHVRSLSRRHRPRMRASDTPQRSDEPDDRASARGFAEHRSQSHCCLLRQARRVATSRGGVRPFAWVRSSPSQKNLND